MINYYMAMEIAVEKLCNSFINSESESAQNKGLKDGYKEAKVALLMVLNDHGREYPTLVKALNDAQKQVFELELEHNVMSDKAKYLYGMRKAFRMVHSQIKGFD